MRGYWLLLTLGLAQVTLGQGVDLAFLQTRAEATGFAETTRYDEVMAFLDVLEASSRRIHVMRFGYTTEGRALPLVIYGEVVNATDDGVQAALAPLRVLIVANIHGGEVAGKEATLMLLRALAAGMYAEWADSLVLLAVPIYNADGNERISLYNRPRQNGPIGGMGQRSNAQGYDLNRDFMKADAPETRALLQVLRDYNPHVLIDLHTTDGTYHAYPLTYAPPLHPSTPASLVDYLRRVWLPAIDDTVWTKHRWKFFYYGNLPWPGSKRPPGWYTFDHRPRFATNYVGLRGIIGLLSEAYAYAPFEERIEATYAFLEAALSFAAAHASEIRALVEQAQQASPVGQPIALRARITQASKPALVLLGAVDSLRHPYTGRLMLQRRKEVFPELLPLYDRFMPTETISIPQGYLVPDSLARVRDLLEVHGIPCVPVKPGRTLAVERFRIDSVAVADQPYQGHRGQEVWGKYVRQRLAATAGDCVVTINGRTGRLAALLLEPRSDDGVVAWGLVKDYVAPGRFYPIARIPVP
ncbi:M14 family metallopeptidase [Rhodothermus profundi]|uniref:Zinc carboxypeptidase n=1 Tax=Rhodothermus profundi TaxID=633813 RepID=A0A1M6PBV4_9BACT|nr:M14 family metallopeptidase [Rhodothermus profundi]SHK05441.1 Zinc carboxypeptidase [Rhodothermus profundi]